MGILNQFHGGWCLSESPFPPPNPIPVKTFNQDKKKKRCLLRQKGATMSASTKGLCVTGWGESSTSLWWWWYREEGVRVGGGGGGMNQEGRGVAVIRSLRGGTRSVVEALSLRIRAECPPHPHPPPKIEEGPPREHLHGQAHTTHIHTQVRECVSVTCGWVWSYLRSRK